MKTIILQATVPDDFDISRLGEEFRELIEARGAMATGVDGYAVHHLDNEEVDVKHAVYPTGVWR